MRSRTARSCCHEASTIFCLLVASLLRSDFNLARVLAASRGSRRRLRGPRRALRALRSVRTVELRRRLRRSSSGRVPRGHGARRRQLLPRRPPHVPRLGRSARHLRVLSLRPIRRAGLRFAEQKGDALLHRPRRVHGARRVAARRPSLVDDREADVRVARQAPVPRIRVAVRHADPRGRRRWSAQGGPTTARCRGRRRCARRWQARG